MRCSILGLSRTLEILSAGNGMVDTSLSGKPEWALHAVGQPSANADRHSAECYPLQDVVHFTHISEAFRIFEDKVIRPNPAGLGDLKGVRANVIWLSPNVYSASYYGSIGFRFNWRALRDRKTLHWVQNTESGYRILISGTTTNPKGASWFSRVRCHCRTAMAYYLRVTTTIASRMDQPALT